MPNNTKAAGDIQTAINTFQPMMDALAAALVILKDGYVSDGSIVDQRVSEALASAVAEATAPITQQLQDAETALATEQANHQTDNTNNETTIAGLQQQVTDLQAQVSTLTAASTASDQASSEAAPEQESDPAQ